MPTFTKMIRRKRTASQVLHPAPRWSSQEFRTFRELYGEYLNRHNLNAERELVDEAEAADRTWSELTANPVGRAISHCRGFTTMLKRFDAARRKSAARRIDNAKGAVRPDEQIALSRRLGPGARIELLWAVAFHVNRAWTKGWDEAPRRLTAEQRESAIKHTKGLLKAFDRGLQFSGDEHTMDFRLCEQLSDLLHELVARGKERRREWGSAAARRHALSKFTQALAKNCGWCEPSAVLSFAEIIAMPCDPTLAKRVSRDGREVWRRFAERDHGVDSLHEVLSPELGVT